MQRAIGFGEKDTIRHYLFVFTVEIDLEKVQKEWHQSSGQIQIKNIATHYGIYNHLFGRAYFLPRIHLNVKVSAAVFSLSLIVSILIHSDG